MCYVIMCCYGMLHNMGHVMLYNMCHALYDMCYVM